MAEAELGAEAKLERLLGYVEADPGNPSLLVDAAGAAIAARHPDKAVELIDRLAAMRELSDGELHLLGLAALQVGNYQRASAIFRSLLDRGLAEPGIGFNLAWSLAAQGERDAAIALLDDAMVRALPQAAMLKVQLLHARGDLEAAEGLARQSLERHASHSGLLAATSVLAVDLGDLDLARSCATRAGDHPDALATLGTLALDSNDPAEARSLFEHALRGSAEVPRAWVGLGLARLASGENAQAANAIDRGAELFGDHLGSFVAAGWAHFIAGRLDVARARFQRALDLDPGFAEAHGSLAVIDLMEERSEEAQRRIEVARRLDRASFSAMLAQILARAGSGDEEGARRLFDQALHAPVDESGRTLAQALARLGTRRS